MIDAEPTTADAAHATGQQRPPTRHPRELPTVRDEHLESLRRGIPWDLIVIGGGATGLGTAVDAAARGYRVALVEAHDFAKGTSSRSTKLIHGGVRYLEQGRVSLVREALRERRILLANAPHLVHSREFLVPAYARWDRAFYGLGLTVYDLLAGRQALSRSRILGLDETLELVPTLRRAGLRGGVVYRDGQFNDARLAIALLMTLHDLGGTAVNSLEVMGFRYRRRRIAGVEVRDRETGESIRLESRGVVNATGVFADTIRSLDQPGVRPLLRPSRGVHVVLDRAFLPSDAAVLIPRTEDGRVIFAIPWEGKTLLGTTDTPTHAADIEPPPTPADVDYLLHHAARYLDPAPTRADIRSAFAGLRPLIGSEDVGSTSGLSREHHVEVSESGMVTITGGKWTTYRRMASDAVDRALIAAGLEPRPAATENLRLHGWVETPDPRDRYREYGADSPSLHRLERERPELAGSVHPRLPLTGAEVVWAARREWARTIEDVLARRSRALFLDAAAALESAPTVGQILARELGRGDDWIRRQVALFADLALSYQVATTTPLSK